MDAKQPTNEVLKSELKALPVIGTQAFETFLLAEYTNIAQAFFNAGAVITQFFQYYLLALTVPITAAGVVLKVSAGTIDLWWLMHSGIAPYLGGFFLAIGLVGLCMAIYIMNLRLDALLYARTVNGIRGYFYDLASLTAERESLIRILPKDVARPNYSEPLFFLPVVAAFALMNSVYAFLSMLLLDGPACLRYLVPTAMFILHFVWYWILIKHRANHYLRRQ